MNPFKAIIFDLDGTLVDSILDLSTAMNHVLEANQLPIHSTSAYKLFVGNGIRKLVERALPDTHQTDETVERFHQQMVDYYRTHCTDYTRPYEGIKALLEYLEEEQITRCILSNKAHELTQRIVDRLFAPSTFQHVQGAMPAFPRKPDPTAAKHIAEQMGIDCSRFLYLGDTNVDIQTAHGAGMFAVGCTWGFRSRAELADAHADLIVDHPSQLITFLKQQQ